MLVPARVTTSCVQQTDVRPGNATQAHFIHSDAGVPLLFSFPPRRDSEPAGGAVSLPGAAVGVAAAAVAGPAGVPPSKGRTPAGVLPRPGQAGRALLRQDPRLQRAPALQVSLAGVCAPRDGNVRYQTWSTFVAIAGTEQARGQWKERERGSATTRRGGLKAELMT